MKSASLLLRFILPLMAILIFTVNGKTQPHCKVAIQALPDFCDPNSDMITLTVIPTTDPDPPYTYIWSTGATTQTITVPNVIGLITVTVINASGCPASAFYFIPGPLEPFAYFGHCFICCPGEIQVLEAWWTNYTPPPNISYLWSTGETTSSIQTTIPGYYTVTITDPANGCTIVVGGDTEYLEASDVEIDGPLSICTGQSVTLTAVGGPFTSYGWLPNGETTQSIEVSEPGTYIVFVTEDGVDCPGSDTLVIEPVSGNIPPPQFSGPVELCAGANETITITNEDDYIGFMWNIGETTSAIDITGPGTYTVTVTDAGGCTSSGIFTVDLGEANLNLTSSIMPETSCTNPNGMIDLTVSPLGIYSYSWSNGAITEDLNNLPADTYVVTVTDDAGCTSSASFIVTSNQLVPGTNTNITASTCDLSNGAIDLSVTPSGSYTFNWSNGNTTEDLSNILAGTYSVTVTSSTNGCIVIATVPVPNINQTFTITGNITPLTSCSSPNGAIDISLSPTGTYTYAWSNGETTEDIANLTAGNYTVIVSAGGSCTANETFSIANNTNPPVPTASSTAATCGQSNGAIDLNVTPTGTYTYLWSNGSSTEDLSVIPGGSYTVTVTSTDGCSNTTNVIVEDNIIPLVISGTTIPNTSCASSNGAIDISVNPPASYSFLWSNGATTEDLINIPSGTYAISATLGLTCTSSESFIVSDNPTVILLSGNTTPNTSCSLPNGTIDLIINTPGVFIYVWSNGQTTEDLQQLTGGSYTVTVTGEDGCTNTATFDIINTSANFSFIGDIAPNTSCTIANGAIDLTVFPTGTYSFLWSNGASSEDLQNLSQGTYGVTVTDINSCSSVATFSVGDTLALPETSAMLTPATCNGNNGAIDLSVIPVIGNSLLWSNGSTSEDLSNLSPGNYSVTVTNANGCISSDTFMIINQNSNFTLSAIPNANNSCLNPNGSIDLSVTPSATYSFFWSNGAVTEDLQNLADGNYAVTVTDILNCSSSDTFTILNNTTAPTLSATITPAVCGEPIGAIDLVVIPGVNNSFVWSNGAVSEDLANVSPSTYSVIVTDPNGCQALDTFDVLNINNNFTFSALPVPNTSCLNPNGSIDLSVTPLGTYTFLWSNGIVAEDLTSLSAGSYTVTVTDASNCSSTGTFVVADNSPVITIESIVNPSICGAGNGSIDLTITPSAGNIFIWSSGAITEDVQNLNAGNISVTVTDPGGCTAADTFTVPEIGISFSLSGIPTANTDCISPNGSIDLTTFPNGTYSYIWSNAITSEDQASLAPGIYTVTVSDVNGCSSTESFMVADQTIQPVIAETIVPSTCGNANGQIDISISPAGSYLFVWSNGNTTEDLSDVPSGMYAVTATDMNGCSASASLVVTNTNTNFMLTAIPSANTSCTQSNGAINLTVVPSGTYSFLWSNGSTSEDLVNIPAGVYTVTVSDATNCSSSAMYTVEDQAVNLDVGETITPALCGEANGSIDLAVMPTSGNRFNWSDGSTTEDLNDILPGQYNVTVTSQTGCLWTSGFTVPGSEKLEIELEIDVIQSGDAFVTLRVQVNVPLTAIDTILWLPEALFDCIEDFCIEQTITRPSAQTEISVIAIDTNGCVALATLQLEEESNPIVTIPNVFSPNADGINDMFTVYGNKDVELIEELQIFDRWGNQVFVNTTFPPNEENYGWDGSFKNAAMNPAVFAYVARVRFKDGRERAFKGDVTVVR
jgi:gliding motility-associated-like protein